MNGIKVAIPLHFIVLMGTVWRGRTMVRLGTYSLTRSTTSVAPQDFTISDRRDGGYNTNTKENDITIVILDRDAVFNGEYSDDDTSKRILIILEEARTIFCTYFYLFLLY